MDYIGFIAAFLTSISFAPQAIKTIRTRSTESISLRMYVILTTGVICWLIYGFYLKDFPIIFANSVTLLLAGTILVMKLKFG